MRGQVRTPAVAGTFYPGQKDQLIREIRRCFLHRFGPGREPPAPPPSKRITGIICPHAGYAYSGPVAAMSYYAVSGQGCDLAIIIGPNHWGIGENVATTGECTWQTPLGGVQVDSAAAEEMAGYSDAIETDFFSHTRDHSIEVQVPMIRYVFGDGVRILPVIMNRQDIETAKEVGDAAARVAAGGGRNSVVIGSSDLTHYEDNRFAHEQDSALLEPVGRLDVEGFYSVLGERRVSACGYGAMASVMTACKRMGAAGGEVLRYATSGDVTGDGAPEVVGYGAVAFG